MIIAVKSQIKHLRRARKKVFRGFNGIRTRGLCFRAAALYQLSYEDPYTGGRPIYWSHVHFIFIPAVHVNSFYQHQCSSATSFFIYTGIMVSCGRGIVSSETTIANNAQVNQNMSPVPSAGNDVTGANHLWGQFAFLSYLCDYWYM